jgi:tRNA-specific 2-thiouridylase
MTKPKALVAMSGGVDSSVAAALMVEEGYDVTGVMLKLWQGEAENNASGCCNVYAAEDARRVADVLGIPFYCLNFAETFEATVVQNFHDDYASGRTPNPCVRCNQWIKFGTLFERAKTLGADVLVTGHYARVRRSGERHQLLRGVDGSKDQSYVLWMLSQEELAHTRFPIGEMNKTETRRIAAELGLRTAAKPDSQEICFVRNGDTAAYVDSRIPEAATPGSIVDGGGRVLGTHRGIGHYTVGQRKGLGISLGKPVFVTAIDAAENTVIIGDREDLAVGGLGAAEVSFVDAPPAEGDGVYVQHRAHGEVHRGRVVKADARGFEIDYDEPVLAVAPGQSAALYSLDEPELLLGGGIISATVPAPVPA